MKLLLDTHIWIWTRTDRAKLTPRVRRSLENPANEIWLSPLSILELLNLIGKGRLKTDLPLEEFLETMIASVPLREAPVNYEVALATRKLSFAHGDPVDRLLAATAIVYGLTMVTADERLLRVRGLPTLANR